jgi:hypothetical protein
MVVIGVVLHDAFTIIWVEWGGGRERAQLAAENGRMDGLLYDDFV